MWLAALAGRLAYFTHRASGHQVRWNRPAADGSLCSGDIVCYECSQVLWCRAHDPWHATAVEVPPDHWGGTRPDETHSELFESLHHILQLAEECPSGPIGDTIRRGACELIEADSWRSRSLCRHRMLESVARLQRRQLHGESRAGDPTLSMLKRLGDALRLQEDE
jgi:hypothetical protein